MIDFGLKPCPLCGGEPEVARLTQGPAEQSAVIKCADCGLTLEWETNIRVAYSRSGKQTTVKNGLDPIEAWNRRVCENCGDKLHSDTVSALNSCNDCGARECEYKPVIGGVRINCPLWRAQEETP